MTPTQLPLKSKYDEYVKIGLLRSQTHGKLTVYVYTELTQFDNLWNTVTRSARGIVFDNDGELVQRCLPKFFNHDEPMGILDSLSLKAQLPVVQDKLDGSLIKVSQHKKHGLVVTSKASFTSNQAIWANDIIKEQGYVFQEGYTYHFELIHPANQIVLNYGDKKGLVLLAIVENGTGKELNVYKHEYADQFEVVEKLPNEILSNVDKLNENGLHEGVVANFGDYRLKYKTDEYVRLHRIVTDLTPKRVWEALSQGQTIERLNIPEEFLEWLETTEKRLNDEFKSIRDNALKEYEITKELSNKEIGLSDNKYKSYIFSLRNNRSIDEMIWKQIKPKGGEEW